MREYPFIKPGFTFLLLLSLAMFTSCDHFGMSSDGGLEEGLRGDILDRFGYDPSRADGESFSGDDLDGAVLRVRRLANMNFEDATKYKTSKEFVLDSLYREISSPYPGALSNRVACPDEYKPVRVRGEHREHISLYATGRLTFGACSEDLITYEAHLAFIYCPVESSLYQVELFLPRDAKSETYRDAFQGLSCGEGDLPWRLKGESPALIKDGEEWWPLGQNVAWVEEWDTHDYGYYFARLQEAGVQLVRVVLAPWNMHESWQDATQSDRERLTAIQEVLEEADRHNLSVILALDIYGELRAVSDDPREMLWEEHPLNRRNGGHLGSPEEFFSDPKARELYKDRLRRLAESLDDQPALYVWEFWNEVDITDDYASEIVCRWHEEMAQYLNDIDPDRYITTSLADFTAGDCIWRLPEIDLVMVHYHGADLIENIPKLYLEASIYGKPVLLEEFSLGPSNQASEQDKEGRHILKAIEATRESGFAAGPMSWWWDSYIDAYNLYHLYEQDIPDGETSEER